MKMPDLVKAAQKYDFEHRPHGQSWHRITDSQVERLLLGAKIAKEEDEQRRGSPASPSD